MITTSQWSYRIKVEKFLKGSLDSIPSPSVKIQIMGGKVCLRCKGKTLLGWKQKKFVDITQQFSYYPKYFPTNNLNFYLRWWDRIQAIFLILSFFNTQYLRNSAIVYPLNMEWRFHLSYVLTHTTNVFWNPSMHKTCHFHL